MKKLKLIVLAFCTTIAVSTQAQIQPFITHSDLIIEGVVLSKTSNWNNSRTEIETENEILVKSVFKGITRDSIIKVITAGGIVGGDALYQTHAIELGVEEEGYFFLRKKREGIFLFSDVSYGFAKENADLNPKVFFLNEKYLKESFEKKLIEFTLAPKVSIQDILEFQETPSSIADQLCDHHPSSRNLKTIEFTFENVEYTENFTKLEFDVIATVNTPGLKFGRADLFINYSSAFGENLVTNQIAQITKGAILEGNLYSLGYEDVTSSKIAVETDSEIGVNSLFTFSETGESIVHIKVDINDVTDLGSISFDDVDISGDVYYWCDGSYELFDEVILDGPISRVSPQIGNEIGITYFFENVVTNESETRFSVDLMVEATGESYLADGFVYLNYNSLGFGEFVYTNGTFSLERGDVISDVSVYQEFISDLDENTLQIVLFTEDNTNQSNLSVISATPEKLATLTFDIVDCEQTRGLSFNELDMIQAGTVHYTGNMPIPWEAYDPIVANDEDDGTICGCEDPIISGFTPDRIPAGMGEVLTITGSGFLSQDIDSKIFFANGDNGGFSKTEVSPADIISWGDNTIEVVIPGTDRETYFSKPPCSGKFKVENRCGYDESSSDLEIPYSIMNIRGLTSEKIAMKDDLCIGFSSDIPMWARNTFKSAMDSWCAKLNMNIKVDYLGNAAVNSIAIDNVSVVAKEEVNVDGGIASLVICNNNCGAPISANLYIEICQGVSNVFKEIDFKISDQALNGSMQSLYNVLLHEIGHALMLNHSKKIGNTTNAEARYVMYYNQTNLNFNGLTRLIKNDDEEGALTLFTNSIEAIQNCGEVPISEGHCGKPCETTFLENMNFVERIELSPNPNKGRFKLNFKDNTIDNFKLTIYSLAGKVMYQDIKKTHSSVLDYSVDLNSGIYILEITSEEGEYWATKMIVE